MRHVDIATAVRRVRERMREAAARSGRKEGDVSLVAVSKFVDTDRIKEAIAEGVAVFGENYVQEASRKIAAIGHGVEWHMTGHLQKNKAKDAVSLFDMVETLDSLDLAAELNKRGTAAGKVIDCLIEVNLGGEGSKSGIAQDRLNPLLKDIQGMGNIRVGGLMCIPPYNDDPNAARFFFRRLRELRDKANEAGFSIRELSMGMSHDFEAAIEEGATIIRVGTAIFGSRIGR